MGAIERFERHLRERLEAAPDSERGAILRAAVDLARPLVTSGQITRARAISTIHAIGREHDIKTLKPAKPAGFFQSLNDDGPQAA
jgi:hypothetical protein